MIKGFDQRVEIEMSYLVSDTPFKVVRSETKYSAWKGGQMLASLSKFKEMCVTKQQFEEYGSQYVCTKCF